VRAVPASGLGLDRLVEIWNRAYAGYFVPMSWDLAQLRRHVEIGSIDLERSLVWMDGADPVALSLLGVRGPGFRAESEHSTGWGADHSKSSAQDLPLGCAGVRAESEHSTGWGADHSKSSAHFLPRELGERGWIGGFGIAPSHRGRGLAAGLLREQLAVARESGVHCVQLEVLTQNWAARSYERAGFVTTRRLSVLHGTLADPWASAAASPAARWLAATDVPDLALQLRRLHGACPAAWTREPESHLLHLDELRCLTVEEPGDPSAALVLRDQAGTLQVVDAAAQDETAARLLVAALVGEHRGRECRVVNEPEGSPLVAAFAAAGLIEVLAQYEMHWHA
jgi:ribosomal protein S18 acetylase RimI-like enzyme